jgi:hypothetical protein
MLLQHKTLQAGNEPTLGVVEGDDGQDFAGELSDRPDPDRDESDPGLAARLADAVGFYP